MIISLSAYIIAKNEARDLPGCLESLKGLADQVIVVDDESPTIRSSWPRIGGESLFPEA